MYRKILVAVDGSTMSHAALEAALELARAVSGHLRLLHVVDFPYEYPEVMYGRLSGDLEARRQGWHEAGQRVLDEALARARQTGCEPEAVLVEASGANPSRSIVEEGRRWGADLIVVGTHGRCGVGRVLLGSVAEGVARTATAPVLLVRPQETTGSASAAA